MLNELTPNERQAAMIADLEARLSLASEKLYYTASQNSLLRSSMTILVDTFTDNARGLGDVNDRMHRLYGALDVARSTLMLSPYLPETTKTK